MLKCVPRAEHRRVSGADAHRCGSDVSPPDASASDPRRQGALKCGAPSTAAAPFRNVCGQQRYCSGVF